MGRLYIRTWGQQHCVQTKKDESFHIHFWHIKKSSFLNKIYIVLWQKIVSENKKGCEVIEKVNAIICIPFRHIHLDLGL